jgi:hypothetical protein
LLIRDLVVRNLHTGPPSPRSMSTKVPVA